MKVSVNGKLRKLVIDKATMEDAGEIRAITNADETSCKLQVKRMNINISLYYDILMSMLYIYIFDKILSDKL